MLKVSTLTKETNTAFFDDPSKWTTTGTVTPLEIFTETTSLLITHSRSTIFDKKVTARVTKITDSSYRIKKNTQVLKWPEGLRSNLSSSNR